MKVLIIGTRFVSIPSLRGGAIEGLIFKYLEHNSIAKKNEITIYSPYDDLLDDYEFSKFSNNRFRFIIKKKKFYKILRLFCGLMRKLFKNCYGDEFVRCVVKDLKKRNELSSFDKIIILNNINNITYLCKKIRGEHILYLHNDYLNINTPNRENIIKSVDKVWCVSDFIKRQVDAVSKNNKTVVIYNGTDLCEFQKNVEKEQKEKMQKKYSIKDTDFVVLYTGRIIPGKGVKELIQAYKIFSKNISNTKLFILGGPDDTSKKYYNNLIQTCSDFSDRIYFLGRVEHETFNLFYKIASVQVVPSLCNEAFGLTVVEGMAAGVPLIVSNSGGIPELVSENCAIVVDKDNIEKDIVKSLNVVYRNENNITNLMIRNAKLKVNDFSLDNFFSRFDDLLK